MSPKGSLSIGLGICGGDWRGANSPVYLQPVRSSGRTCCVTLPRPCNRIHYCLLPIDSTTLPIFVLWNGYGPSWFCTCTDSPTWRSWSGRLCMLYYFWFNWRLSPSPFFSTPLSLSNIYESGASREEWGDELLLLDCTTFLLVTSQGLWGTITSINVYIDEYVWISVCVRAWSAKEEILSPASLKRHRSVQKAFLCLY